MGLPYQTLNNIRYFRLRCGGILQKIVQQVPDIQRILEIGKLLHAMEDLNLDQSHDKWIKVINLIGKNEAGVKIVLIKKEKDIKVYRERMILYMDCSDDRERLNG